MQTIKKDIQDILSLCNALYGDISQYRQKAEQIKSYEDLTEVAKRTRIEELKRQTVADGEAKYQSINEKFDILFNDISSSVNSFDMNDNTFLRYVKVIHTVNGNIAETIRKNILTAYKGKNTALDMIINVFKQYEIETYDFESAKINLLNIKEQIRKIKNNLYFAINDMSNATFLIQEALQDVNNIAESLNVEISEE